MKKPLICHVLSLLLFGMNGIIAGGISLDSYEIVFYRTLLGSLILAVIFFAGKGRITALRNKKHFALLCTSGVAMGASWMFLYESFDRVGVSVGTLLYYCAPVLVMALSPFIFGEKLTLTKILGFIAVLAGVFLVNGTDFEGGGLFGFLCAVGAAGTYAVMVICNKKAESITGLENSMLQLFTGFITVAVFVAIKGGNPFALQGTDIVPILVLGLINTGIGCYMYFSSIGKLPMQTVAVLGYLEPLSAVFFSALVLKETLGPVRSVGAALIIGGAMFAELCNFTHKDKNKNKEPVSN